MSFKKATREQLFLRMAIDGPAGSGKSVTGLRFATALALASGTDPSNFSNVIAAIDSERRSLSKYVGETYDGVKLDFAVEDLESYAPTTYTEKIQNAGKQGFKVLLIDSLSHAWAGEGGALEIKERMGQSITHWKDVTPMHNRMVNAILQYPGHVIVTMRSKVEYIIEKDEKGKVTDVKKVGLAPVQRQGMEYEFDVYGTMDWSHTLKITKTRCRALDGLSAVAPGADFIRPLISWLTDGTPPPPPKEPEKKVSDEVHHAIMACLEMLKVSPEKATASLKKRFQLDSFSDLTESQAATLLADLEPKLKTVPQPS